MQCCGNYDVIFIILSFYAVSVTSPLIISNLLDYDNAHLSGTRRDGKLGEEPWHTRQQRIALDGLLPGQSVLQLPSWLRILQGSCPSARGKQDTYQRCSGGC